MFSALQKVKVNFIKDNSNGKVLIKLFQKSMLAFAPSPLMYYII